MRKRRETGRALPEEPEEDCEERQLHECAGRGMYVLELGDLAVAREHMMLFEAGFFRDGIPLPLRDCGSIRRHDGDSEGWDESPPAVKRGE